MIYAYILNIYMNIYIYLYIHLYIFNMCIYIKNKYFTLTIIKYKGKVIELMSIY